MGRRWTVFVMGLGLATLMAAQARAIELSVVGMGEGNVVSDVVRLNVSAPSSPEGYVVLKVDGAFVEAQAPPFSFQWDTSGVADGPHIVLAQEIGEDGSLADEVQISLRVSNRIQVDGPVRLEYRLQEGSEANYRYTGYSDLIDRERRHYQFVPNELYRSVAAQLTGAVRETFSGGPEGSTEVLRQIQSGLVEFPDRFARLEGAGPSTRFLLSADGSIKEGAEPLRPEALFGLVFIPIPAEPISRGQSWTGPLWSVLGFAPGQTVFIAATHELVDFVRVRGERCAVIRSRFQRETPLSITVDTTSQDMGQASTKGTRTTYFSLETGRIFRAVEDVTHTFTIHASEYSIIVPPAALGGPPVPGASVPSTAVPPEIPLEYAVRWRADRAD